MNDPAVTWALGHAAHLPPGDGWLTAAEVATQQRFVVPRRRADWRLGRFTAKALISEWTGAAPPAEIGVVPRGPTDGFPLVEGVGQPAPRLSLTHRGGMAVACIAEPGSNLGCDLERVEPRATGFVADWFTRAEQRFVERAAADRRAELVTLTWSVKEAALKAIGMGLRIDTREVETHLGSPPGGHTGGIEGSWRPVSAEIAGAGTMKGWWRPLIGYVLVVVVADGTVLGQPPQRSWPSGVWPEGAWSKGTGGVHTRPGTGGRNYGAQKDRNPPTGGSDYEVGETETHIEEMMN